MKITIDIDEVLMRAAHRVANRDNVSIDAVVERGLRRTVTEIRLGAPFKLRRVRFKGDGLRAKNAMRRGAISVASPIATER